MNTLAGRCDPRHTTARRAGTADPGGHVAATQVPITGPSTLTAGLVVSVITLAKPEETA